MMDQDEQEPVAPDGQPELPVYHQNEEGLKSAILTREMIAHMRHELRTPVNHIVGYSEMLQEEAEDGGHASLMPGLQTIRSAGGQLLDIINRHLASDEVGSPEKLVSGLRKELASPLREILTCGEILEEIAKNEGRDDYGPDIQNIGIAAIRLLTIVSDGSLVKGLHAGDIASTPPSQMAEASEITATADQSIAIRGPFGRKKRSTFLVVDDDKMNRDLLVRRLERQGHEVAEAEDGSQALDMIRTSDFDLILLDIMMPKVDGFQVLKSLKSDEYLRHIPVILLSALDDMDNVVKGIEMGAEDYLPKPINNVLLEARIGASLEKKHLRDQEVLHLRQIELEKKRADDLLHVILPEQIVDELKETGVVRPRRYEDVAVLFCDIVEFTSYCDARQPEEVIPGLQRLVEAYEELTIGYNLEKIKTIGDSFMIAAGLLNKVESPVFTSVKCGLDMISVASQMPENWRVRIGIHFGPVMAGVVGNRQYLFDLWGDTVNTAARIETHGMADAVNLSNVAWQQISDRCIGKSLGMVQAKGKGELEIFQFERFLTE